jgi:cytochrome c biogenesis protein CcdA/thiol-disulfide isomerase/thioredoxin
MILLLTSFIAGILTILAPCILPLLPVIVGSSIVDGKDKRKSYVIIGSLIFSIVLFTLILKWSTAFITIPQVVWTSISGGIIILFAFTMIFPGLWENLPFVPKLSTGSNKLLGKGYQRKGLWGDVIMGAALGPVFSSCSPTYFIILATVLPQSFAKGLIDLFAYAFGLGLSLLIISLVGQRVVGSLGKVSDPRGWFKRGIGILLLVVGLAIITGFDKKIETSLIKSNIFDITKVETGILQKNTESSLPIIDVTPVATTSVESKKSSTISKKVFMTSTEKAKKYPKYVEITNPAGFVNTNDIPVTIGQHIGKDVILVDFLTYSCINCQRTFPYLKTWYEKYHKDGLEIIAIHTPEFAFEKNKDNVKNAMKEAGLTFPVVLDNEYGTWNAYKNSYWPRKYLIDIDGYIVYDHIGEGEYDKTEQKIVDLLAERADRLGQVAPKDENASAKVIAVPILGESPETYLGSGRQGNFANKNSGVCTSDTCEYTVGAIIPQDSFALGGSWKIGEEYITSISNESSIKYHFKASKVYLVADALTPIDADIYLDGILIPASQKGTDVSSSGKIIISGAKLYNIVNFGNTASEHVVEIKIHKAGLKAFTFTFG